MSTVSKREEWYQLDDTGLFGFCPDAMVGSADLSWEAYKDGVQVASSADGNRCYGGEETVADCGRRQRADRRGASRRADTLRFVHRLQRGATRCPARAVPEAGGF